MIPDVLSTSCGSIDNPVLGQYTWYLRNQKKNNGRVCSAATGNTRRRHFFNAPPEGQAVADAKSLHDGQRVP